MKIKTIIICFKLAVSLFFVFVHEEEPKEAPTSSMSGNIIGNELDNTIVGNSGANTLIGAGGDDTISGGAVCGLKIAYIFRGQQFL